MATDVLGLTEMTEGQAAKHTTFNTAIQTIEKNTIIKVASVTVGMQTADGKQTLYTVGTGLKFIPTHLIVRNPTASLAGGTDYDFGDGANADTWKQAVDLSGMTDTSSFFIITQDDTAEYSGGNPLLVFDAADVFAIKPITGSSADANATIDVFGYIYDA